MENIKEYVKLGLSILTFVGGIFSLYLKLKTEITKMKSDIETNTHELNETRALFEKTETELKDQILQESHFRRNDIDKMLSAFKEGLKTEIVNIQRILGENRENSQKLWEKVDAIGDLISRVDTKLGSHIENQKTICTLNHRWNGEERRRHER